jgi:hypothetical protein
MNQNNEESANYSNDYYNVIDIFIDNSLDQLSTSIKKSFNISNVEETIKTFKSKLNFQSINELITDKMIKEQVIVLIDNYFYIYLLLLLSFDNDIDSMRKLLITNQKKINYLSKSDNLSLIIDKSIIIQNLVLIIQKNNSKTEIKNLNKAEETYYLYELFRDEEKELISSKKEGYKHLIIKFIIFLTIYINIDKTKIFKIIEKEELSKSEFIYIDVIESFIDEIDYSIIEKIFSVTKNFKATIADTMYELLTEEYTSDKPKVSLDTKINTLFNNKILIPITDEFLRFHKDNERYDNIGQTVVDKKNKLVPKKDNTKIKYIVNKINKLVEYYNIKKKLNKTEIDDVEKNFYSSLIYRKAVLINEIEELSIINKIINQGKKAMDNNEYYSDLISFRTYPYINFKDFMQNGFNFKLDNSQLAIRYCNFEFKDATKNPTQYKSNLQVRTAPQEHNVNIVGVAINPLKIDNFKRKLETTACIKLNNTYDISNQRNGYLSTLSILKKLLTQDVHLNKLPYWIFNKDNDKIKIKSYEVLSNMNSSEYYKFLLGKLYDNLISVSYEKIILKINEETDADLFRFKQIVDEIQNKIININDTTYYSDVFAHIYFNKLMLKSIQEYDTNENKIPGLNSKLVKIPSYIDDTKKDTRIVIRKQEYLTGKVEEEVDPLFEYASCQHQVTWNQINMYKRKDPSKFNQLLYQFIKKYVTENSDKEYICKSCNQFVEVKKYIFDTFANNLTNVALSVPLEADLEHIPEYEKYNKAIKNMDKNVEKLASVTNIQYYLGSNVSNKYKRQDIVKNIIDLINAQYQQYDVSDQEMRRKRLEKAHRLYGISETKSTYFIFEMDNNLFTFSSKDTDKFKKYKNNNIYAYMIFLMLCELNTNQITQLTYDKIINYAVFDKLSFGLFDGLSLRINNSNDIKPLSNYKLLCYVIYYLSSMLIKYNMWYIESSSIVNKPNFIHPEIQKIIIHTIVDLINSILEINTKKEKSYIYEAIATKFFTKLNYIYDNKISKEQLDYLSVVIDKKIQIVNNKIKVKVTDEKLLINLEKHHDLVEYGYNKFKVLPGRYYIRSYIEQLDVYKTIGIDNLNNLNSKLYKDTLEKIYKFYYETGDRRHLLSFDPNIDLKVLEKHANTVLKNILDRNQKQIKSNFIKNKQIEEMLEENKDFQEEYMNKAFKTNDIGTTIDILIDNMEKIIGQNLNINNSNMYLKKNVYIIDHDHLGHSIEPLIFTDSDNKIEMKKDEPFFKCDVYYYLDKSKNITMYYNAVELFLMGYKEMNRDYTVLKNTNRYLKINYSIKNSLLLLGHYQINHQINDDIKDKKNKLIEETSNIIRTRINNLKNIIKEVQSFIYQIKNYSSSTLPNKIIKQYSDKFKKLNYYSDEGSRIFEDWKMIVDSIFFISLKSNVNIEVINNILNSNKLIKLNNNDNVLLYYLCEQIQEFININKDPYNQSKLIVLLCVIISQQFNKYNLNETINMNNEIRKFNILETNMVNISDQDNDTLDMTGVNDNFDEDKLTDEQKAKIDDENEDMKETEEGMDVDLERDEEITDDADDGDEMLQDRD